MISAVSNHPQREMIDQMLFAKVPLRQIVDAVSPKIGLNTIQRYKVAIFRPAIAAASVSKEPTNRVAISAVQTAVQVQDSPVRQTVAKLGHRIDKALDKAESAVRVVTDKETGELRAVGSDMSVLAPLFGQAHANVKLFAELTGELQQAGTAGLQVQLVIGAPGQQPAASDDFAGTTIDIRRTE